MKILLSTYACDPSAGGEFNNGWRYACNVTGDREIWCLATSEGKKAIEAILQEGGLQDLHMVYVDTPRWLLKWKDNSPILGVYFHYFYWQFLAHRRAKILSRHIHFDVVHHATWSSLQLGSFLWKLKTPMIFGPVGGGQSASRAYKKYFYGYWKFEILREVISFLLLKVFKSASNTLRHAKLVLVNNEDTFALAKKYGAKQVRYAPCTMLADQFIPPKMPLREQETIMRVLWVGRILPRKGLRLILEAFSKIDSHLPIELTIVGYGLLDKYIPEWLDELALNGRVHFKGRLPMEEVRLAYSSHDLFIYCSLRESLAAQFFEAMAFGLPLIVFDLHGAKTFIPEEVAIKVPLTEPEKSVRLIADAIMHMYHHPAQRLSMGRSAYELTKQFTWSKRIAVMNEYYRECIELQHGTLLNSLGRQVIV